MGLTRQVACLLPCQMLQRKATWDGVMDQVNPVGCVLCLLTDEVGSCLSCQLGILGVGDTTHLQESVPGKGTSEGTP